MKIYIVYTHVVDDGGQEDFTIKKAFTEKDKAKAYVKSWEDNNWGFCDYEEVELEN